MLLVHGIFCWFSGRFAVVLGRKRHSCLFLFPPPFKGGNSVVVVWEWVVGGSDDDGVLFGGVSTRQ